MRRAACRLRAHTQARDSSSMDGPRHDRDVASNDPALDRSIKMQCQMDPNRPSWKVLRWSGDGGEVGAPGVATLAFDRGHASFEPVVGEPVLVTLQSGERGSLVLMHVKPYFARSAGGDSTQYDAPAEASAALARLPLPFHGDLEISGRHGHLRGFEASPNLYSLGGADISIEGELRLLDVEFASVQASTTWPAAVDLRMCTAGERRHMALGAADIAVAYVPEYRVDPAVRFIVCAALRWIAPDRELFGNLDAALLRAAGGCDEAAFDTIELAVRGSSFRIGATREGQRAAELLARDDARDEEIANASTWATAVARTYGYALTVA